MVVNDPADLSFNSVDRLGAVILQTVPNFFHVGILYKVDGNDAKVCHLAWHHDLRCSDVPDNRYDWLQSGASFDDVDRKIIVAAVAGMDKRQALSFPYSTIYEGSYFDQHLNYSRRDEGEGLTCSTFIMAAFESLGFPLLQVETWKSRDGDAAWRAEILKKLRAELITRGLPEEHVRRQEARIGDPRFRPEEVVAAIANDNRPIGFDEAVALGAELVAQVRPA